MKKLSLTVKSLLAIAIVAGAASCAKQEAAPAAVATSTEASQAPASLKIAYIDADSVMSAYVLAQQIGEEGQRLMVRYQQQEQSKQQELQKLANSIEQKRQNNTYLSEASFQADVENLQKKQNEAARFLSNQQNHIQNTIAEAQKRLNDSIINCVKAYNATHGYDAILMRDAGVFFNPDLDITAEIIEELNKRVQASESK